MYWFSKTTLYDWIVAIMLCALISVLVAIIYGAVAINLTEFSFGISISGKAAIDIVLTVVTIAIAVIALYATYSHNRISVQPFLVLGFDTISKKEGDSTWLTITIRVANKGLGPALIKNFTFIDSRDVQISLSQISQKVHEDSNRKLFTSTPATIFNLPSENESAEFAIAPGEDLILAQFCIDVGRHPNFDFHLAKFVGIRPVCTYRSLFGKTWTMPQVSIG